MKAMPLVGPRSFAFRDNYPNPKGGVGRTIIKVSAVGLNRLDLLTAAGELGVTLPHICGSDVVGVVSACESGRFGVGTRVLVNPGLPQEGDQWPASRQCPYVRILGAHVDGGMAEYVSVNDEQVYEVPPDLDDLAAATIPLDYLTAWRMLRTKASVQPGESVLIWGAAGSLGCAAIRICQLIGAHAVAVGSRKSDAEPLIAIGASAWLDYTAWNFTDRLTEAAGSGFDVVFESVGQRSWQHSIATVGQSGRIVISGVTSGRDGRTDLEDVYYKQISVLGSRMGYPTEFEEMFESVRAGHLKPGPVAAVFSMRDVAAALDKLKDRTEPGKVVLRNDL